MGEPSRESGEGKGQDFVSEVFFPTSCPEVSEESRMERGKGNRQDSILEVSFLLRENLGGKGEGKEEKKRNKILYRKYFSHFQSWLQAIVAEWQIPNYSAW